MRFKLKELKHELTWEQSVFSTQLQKVEKEIKELEALAANSEKPSDNLETIAQVNNSFQTDLQELLQEQALLRDRLETLKLKLKKIAAANRQ